MICAECVWEGNLRRDLAAKGVDFDTYADRPSMKQRGHEACRGGTWCCCQHRTSGAAHNYSGNPAHDAR